MPVAVGSMEGLCSTLGSENERARRMIVCLLFEIDSLPSSMVPLCPSWRWQVERTDVNLAGACRQRDLLEAA
jgi:hypothetical protein